MKKIKISFHRKKEGRRPKICSHFHERQHASIELATLSKEKKLPLCPPKGSKNCGKFPSKSAPKPWKISILLGANFAPLGSFFRKRPSPSSPLSGKSRRDSRLRKSLVYFLDTNGLQAPKAQKWLVASIFFFLIDESYWGIGLGNHHYQQKAVFFAKKNSKLPNAQQQLNLSLEGKTQG